MKKTLISIIAMLLIACMSLPVMAEPSIRIIDPAAETTAAEITATPEPQPVQVPASVVLPYRDGSINLRADSNTDSAIITSLKHDEKITVILYGDIWSKIQTQTGKQGYIKNLYINDGNPIYAAGNSYFDAARPVVVKAESSMFAGAELNSAVITTLLAGAELTAHAENGAFTLVSLPDGALGYVESAGLN